MKTMLAKIILLIRRKIKSRFLIAAIIVFVAFGLLFARTITRPLDVELRIHIKICQKTEKGKPYKARLLGPAKFDYNPVTGRIQGEMIYEITYGKKTTRVPGKFTTDTQPSPVGDLRGQRAKGILGIERTTVKVVSALTFKPGDSPPLMLLSTEEYKLTPKK